MPDVALVAITDRSGFDESCHHGLVVALDDDLPTVKAGLKTYCANSTTLKNNHPMMLIAKFRQEALMAHPLTRSLLRRKWNIASVFYVTFLLFYALFLGLFSGYMITATPPFAV